MYLTHKGAFILLAMMAGVTLSYGHEQQGVYKNLVGKLNRYNLLEKCFGEQLVGQLYVSIENAYQNCQRNDMPNPMTKLKEGKRRRRRQSNEPVFPLGKEKINEIKEHMIEDEIEMMENLSNLTCVLGLMEWIKDDGSIKMEYFRKDKLRSLMTYTPAGEDEDFINHISEAATDCYDEAMAFPQSILDKHPETKIFRRQMKFFECIFKLSEEICISWQMYHGMADIYGIDVAKNSLGGHGDKFEKGKAAWIEVFKQSPHSQQFIDDFFWTPRVR